MKTRPRIISDAITALLLGFVLHFAGAPFWAMATASIGIFALLGVLNLLMEALDLVGEALDAIILILKDKQQ